jgi:TonB family protein
LTASAAQPQHTKQQAHDQPLLQSAPLTPGHQQSLQIQENAHLVMQRLKIAFSENFTYPKLAQRNGWQGMVKLGLRVEPNGQLSRIRVISTSGYPVLDQAALDTLNRIVTLQGANAWLIGEPVDTVLPVEYKLLGG